MTSLIGVEARRPAMQLCSCWLNACQARGESQVYLNKFFVRNGSLARYVLPLVSS
jgi:hypothetical protein